MMKSRRMPPLLLIIGLLGGWPCLATAQGLAPYRPITDQRLGNPGMPHWLLYRGPYDGWGFHPADLIDTTTVTQVVPLWSFSMGELGGHEAPPLVNAGVMFITTPGNQVIALDAFTGDLRWRYRRGLPADLRLGHRTNRGVGLYEDKVFQAWDVRTMQRAWTQTFPSPLWGGR
jgi:alcohol dehydrogenase (cytochrome c)